MTKHSLLKKLSILSFGAMIFGTSLSLSGCSSSTKALEEVTKVSDTDKTNSTKVEELPEVSPSQQEITTLSDDIFSYQIKIGSTIFQIPSSYRYFKEKGFQTTDDLTQTLEPNNYNYATLTLGKLNVSVGFFNGGINAIPLSECNIGTIDITADSLASGESIILPKNITLGTSTKEEIIAAYGAASETSENDTSSILTYNKAYYEQVSLQISKDTNKLSGISIQNIQENTKQNENDIKNVSKEPTKEASAYQAPTEIGDNFLDFNVEFSGNLYHIPAPVSEFIKNGWELDTKTSDEVVKSGSYGFVYLKKDKQTLNAVVENPSDRAATISHCFVTLIKGDDNSTRVPITISKGISRGMSKADLLVALSGTKFELEDLKDFEYYTLKDRESNNYIQIMIRKDKNVVQAIELSNTTKS